ncbi:MULTISPECIES: SIS domain-containing protein [Eubacteriales]|uniref:Glutamine--fructose-6-phosphate aminotransferase [isomerizing] n=2 Tax=Bittarella massiliensis (ex Durand et al. 2017) TaxID=1720313 RepID=A0ABW9WYU0_9FIRM|nr:MULTISPECIES: SIS domain-containing protein [Eubacteriales]MZL70871.1 SIS domain-containing protein [Bittarella massiliensis (ex Durand et al. 2017)]MZL81015.1 SIS domain-containing protein [Bittarella massiliensis (ex Durand et al. 2017)]
MATGIDIMREELALTPEVIRKGVTDFEAAIREKAHLLPESGLKKIYAVGCGDSLFAAQAARYTFLDLTGVDCVACEALEFCRYEADHLPEGSLVLVISYSGTVARTVESALIAKKRGAAVIAVTGNPDSPLARAAEGALCYQVVSLGYAPGTISFTAALLMLQLCALQIGLRTGHLSEEDARRERAWLLRAADTVEEALAENEQGVRDICAGCADAGQFTVLGAGPNQSMAHFGAAKLVEGKRIDGIPQDLEEWAHLKFFVSGPDTSILICAPQGGGYSRAVELIREMNFIGANSILFTERGLDRAEASHRITYAPGLPERYTPLVISALLGLFGYHICKVSGVESCDFASDEAKEEHYNTLHNSAYREELQK